MRRLLVIAFLATLASSARADAILLDRVVARVEDRVILQSDLLERVRPLLATGSDPKRVMQAALEAMVDEILIGIDAATLHITVGDDDVKRARKAVMERNNLTEVQLEAELLARGIAPAAYDAELRRMLVEGKWLQIRLAKTPKPTNESEMEGFIAKEREAAVQKLRAAAFVDVRL